MMTQNKLIIKNKILTNCHNIIIYIYIHDTSEYYRYINLCNLKSDTLIYFLFHCKHNIS